MCDVLLCISENHNFRASSQREEKNGIEWQRCRTLCTVRPHLQLGVIVAVQELNEARDDVGADDLIDRGVAL